MGYTGGTKLNPTYYSLGDHSETIEITFDPSVITYDELLNVFFAKHTPDYPSSGQYASRIFYHDEAQRQAAEDSLRTQGEQQGKTLYTEILPAGTFYQAEDYHQKYYLTQQRRAIQMLGAVYPSKADFIASTAAARLNGLSGGHGDGEAIVEEFRILGFNDDTIRKLFEAVGETVPACCSLT